MANIELPKDAEGREIPLDVDALYSKDGIRTPVFAWKYIHPRKRKWTVQFIFDDSDCIYYPEDYYLTPPEDSQCHCDSFALEAIKERIRKLRGEGE